MSISQERERGDDGHPVAVIGAGPVGLAAAVHLVERGLPAVVLEAGAAPGAAVREWGHVRLFSPWSECLAPRAVGLLEAAGWSAPEEGRPPTGRELVERYLEPLAALPELRPTIRYGRGVMAVTRAGHDRLRTADRTGAPFVVRYRDGGGERELRARAVIDASGTWHRPRPLGAHGLPALGEDAASGRIRYRIPDVLGSDRERYANRRTAVVGAGHSAAHVLIDLARLAEEAPRTRAVWILRGGRPDRLFDGADDDELEARGALERRLRAIVDAGRIETVTGFEIREVRGRGDEVALVDRAGRETAADRIVGVTGFRPDLEMLRELRLDLDPATGAPRSLGPLIDPEIHSCGTVPPHGEAELRHPEPGFYVVGAKSYGRAPTFLLPTGYEQVRSVVAALAGDRRAAESVELELPATGVCSADPVPEASGAGSCCA